MERSYLEGLNLEAGVIDNILAEHNKSKAGLESQIATLTNSNATLQTQVKDYLAKEETQQFHAKLKQANIKEDRVAAFATLLGEDQSDTNIDTLKKEYPEWIVSQESTPPNDPNQPPTPPNSNPQKQYPNFVPPGNPSFSQGGTDNQEDVQNLLAAWK